MQRLPGVDAGFLYLETPTMHMHTLKIAVLDLGPLAEHFDVKLLKDELAGRLSLLPPFRRRIVPVPYGLHHPVWIEDPDFDIDNHVHALRLDGPGTWEQVEDAIGEIASTPLSRQRPLWEVWAVDGLADGRVVTVAKIHHTLADGVASASLLANVMSTETSLDAPLPDEWRPEPMPERRRLIDDAIRDFGRQFVTLPALLWSTLRRVMALVALKRGTTVATPRPLVDTPRASFNGALTARRNFATTSLPFTDVRRVAKAYGVTVNDVVLAVVGGALRRWMDERGERLAKPLVVSVPVATEKGTRLSGNRLSSLITSLATDVDDPVDRLRRIHDVAVGAKAVQEALGEDLLESWVQFTPPGPMSWFMRAYARLRGADRHRPAVNLVVSNVAGPKEMLYTGGIRLDDLFSVGPVMEGMGLNITAWTYLDRMNVAAIACPDLLPDLRGVTAQMHPALTELLTAALI